MHLYIYETELYIITLDNDSCIDVCVCDVQKSFTSLFFVLYDRGMAGPSGCHVQVRAAVCLGSLGHVEERDA